MSVPMLEVLRSAVNTWECDHMGHMNVRHYLGRANDGLSVLLLQLGFVPRVWRERGIVVRARDQHLRFSRELRPGTGFAIRAGIAAHSPALIAYEELRTLEDEVSATVVTELALSDLSSGATVPWPKEILAAAQRVHCEIPSYAAVRGVVQQPTRARISREQALARGMLPGFLGPIIAEDCDAGGVMREAAFMARISDGIGHFFRALYGSEERRPGMGGAALEYRFVFHRWPRLNDAIEVRSGLSALAPKTQQITHYAFDVATGDCVAGSQAVVVWFDLVARKAIPIPDDLQASLRGTVMADLTL
jgi:acyl-CoA thioester hydrolase